VRRRNGPGQRLVRGRSQVVTKFSHRYPARYFVQLLEYIDELGVEHTAVLRAARLGSLDDPNKLLSLRQVEALFAAAERLSGRFDLGFELGRRVKTTSHDILGYALLTSPTLRDALRLLSSYQRLINPAFTLELQHRERRVDLVYRPAMALSHRAMRIVQETIAVSNHHEFGYLLQRGLSPYDIHFSIERPPHAERYAELAPARVHWGDLLPGLRLSMDAALLDVRLVMADPRAMQAAEQRCVAMMRNSRGSPRWSEWCRMMLREAEDSQPTLEQLARFVNVSARTLSRYLVAEDTGFRELALQVRTERAKRLLAIGDQSVTRIAYRLGYSDVASFIRSFRSRTGYSPGAWGAQASPADRVRTNAAP
jgi:AraC-like DNA-binding protein